MPEDAIRIDPKCRIRRGHAHGLRGPVLSIGLQWPTACRWDTELLASWLHEVGGLKHEVIAGRLRDGLGLDAFLSLVLALEQAAHAPVTQCGLRTREHIAGSGHALAFPSFVAGFTQAVIQWLASAINLADVRIAADTRAASAGQVHDVLRTARKSLHAQLDAGGVNTTRIARACGELGLPWTLLPRSFLQAGSGPNAQLFKSTLTQRTPGLAVQLARSKSLTAQVLALHGLPVPEQRLASSEQDAVRAALELGFPVVVKPDNRDGGVGVHAGLRTETQVAQFYREAAALAGLVLVESHVEGEDVRITVENGRVVKAIARRPGGVLGDGRRTVDELVQQAAAARPAARASGASSLLTLDPEALSLLAERGMSAGSVPAAGDFIALRRRANMSTGGTSRDVLAAMHPDNARLAVRAARALRLDIAGIDLLIPDIGQSWMTCRSAICEVNAQPQLSTEFADSVYRDMITRMVPAPVRQRTMLLLDAAGAGSCDPAVMDAARELAAAGERVLSVRSSGTWLGDHPHAPPQRDPFSAAALAELDTEATAVVAALTVEQVLRCGVPWLHVDEVRVLGGGAADEPRLQACMALLAPHVVTP